MDDLLGLVQELMAAFGADVGLLTLRRVLWLLVGVLLLYWTAGLIKSLLSSGESAYGFARRQIQEMFWRGTDKMAPLISFVLRVIAYAFYGQDSSRCCRHPVRLLPLPGWVPPAGAW